MATNRFLSIFLLTLLVFGISPVPQTIYAGGGKPKITKPARGKSTSVGKPRTSVTKKGKTKGQAGKTTVSGKTKKLKTKKGKSGKVSKTPKTNKKVSQSSKKNLLQQVKKDRQSFSNKKLTPKEQNKMHHIFGKSEHKLEPLVKQYGSEEKAFRALQAAGNKALKEGRLKVENGINTKTQINVGGKDIVLHGGRVIDGKFELGTAYSAP